MAPCTLPVIPVVLGGAAGAGRRRPLGLLVGFAATFLAFTVILASAMAALGVTTDALRLTAAIVIGLMGAVLLIPTLAGYVDRHLPALDPSIAGAGGGFWHGVLLGGAIGLIWAPCAGPLMAAVIAAAVAEGPTANSLLIASAYIVGVAIPLAAVALVGRRALGRVSPRTAGRLRRVFGGGMVVVALTVATGLDFQVQAGLAAFPGTVLAGTTAAPQASDLPPLPDLGPAPELAGISAWINSPPTTLAALRGKVVLVHFWTFACANCRNVQPYVKAWWDRYEADRFVVIGVHTPELSFERDLDNVREAVVDAGVTFPVAVDPDFATWRAFENGSWPAFHFIDKQGHIRYRKGGEGGYATSEAVIRALLAEPG